MATIVWTIIVILFAIGFLGHYGGALINLVLVLLVIGVIYSLTTGRRTV